MKGEKLTKYTLEKFDNARRALAEAKSVDEVKQIRDKAEAFRVYCKQAGESLEMQNWCAEIKLRAERRAGKLLRVMPKQQPGEYQRSHDVTVAPPLADLGISKIQSHRWQKIADIPPEEFEKHIENVKEKNEELTTAGLLRSTRDFVHFSSDSSEWYTPQEIISRTIKVFGEIDLDPCADESHNIPAKKHFTITENGLNQEWHGRIYMNPPYGKEIGDWINKATEEIRVGNTTGLIALLPARTDTAWFNVLRGGVIAFIWGRLRFSGHNNSAPFPSMAVYRGQSLRDFYNAFSDIGTLYRVVGKDDL